MSDPILVKMKKILCLLAVPILVCGCGAENDIGDIQEEETVSVTGSVTENYDHLLVRGWTGSELISSIFYCGEYHSLPLVPEENEGFTLSDGILIFPDGSYASADTDEEGRVTALKFERDSAPKDLSVYGIDFSSAPDDIPSEMGIADSIYGDKEKTIAYSFFGGGIGELTFVYTEKILVSVHIAAEV